MNKVLRGLIQSSFYDNEWEYLCDISLLPSHIECGYISIR